MQVTTSVYLARAAHSLGDYPRSLELARAAVAHLTGSLARERLGMVGFPAITSRGILVLGLIERGELAEALTITDEQRQIAEGIDHPWSLAAAVWSAGEIHLARRDLAKAIPALEHAMGIYETISVRFTLQGVVAQLGYAYALAGRMSDALPMLDRAFEHLDFTTDDFSLGRALVSLGAAYLLADRPDTAKNLAERTLALTQDRGARGHEAWARWLLGEIAAHAEPPAVAQAEYDYRAALARAEELGQCPLAARCHLALGALHQRVGRVEQAQAELTTAAAMYQTMELPFWQTTAEAVLARVTEVSQ